MLEQSELFDLTKKHLTGRLVTSTVSSGTIENITMPSENEFKHMLVLSAADFGENGCLEVMDDRFPFFSSEKIDFKGQPVLAVFGYDTEDLELFCKELQISYRIKPDSEDYNGTLYGEPFIWSSGNTDEYFTPQAKTYKSHFEVSPFSNRMLGDQRVYAVKIDGQFHIRIATQWPIHVRKSVAKALGCRLEDVILYPQPYYAPYDQLIITPSVLASIAALAAEKSGELVQLSSPMVSWQPRITIEHETAYLQDGTPLADRAECTVDLGAFPFFTTEVFHNILAGLVPVYPIKAADVIIRIIRSSSPPANFFGDLGFSMALAGTEVHFSQLASSLGIQPGIWRLNNVKDMDRKTVRVSDSVKLSSDLERLSGSIRTLLEESWYSRKYASNSQKRITAMKMNPLVNYSRGIGIASGEGVMGFSQQFNASADYSLSMTMNENQKLTVNTGMHADKSVLGIWKDVIRQFIDIPAEDIEFLDINSPDIVDIGPSTLSRKMGIVASLLIRACSELSRKITFSRLPITVTTEYEAELSDPFYFTSCIGAVVIDLHIDTVMLSPVIDNVWANFHLGHVFDMDKLQNKARHTVTTVLSDICPRSSENCNIEIRIDQDGSFTGSSLTAGIRGLTTAALVGALSQALGHPIHKIPVTSDDILAIASNQTFGGDKYFLENGGDK